MLVRLYALCEGSMIAAPAATASPVREAPMGLI
jgi:hypothetical protein